MCLNLINTNKQGCSMFQLNNNTSYKCIAYLCWLYHKHTNFLKVNNLLSGKC